MCGCVSVCVCVCVSACVCVREREKRVRKERVSERDVAEASKLNFEKFLSFSEDCFSQSFWQIVSPLYTFYLFTFFSFFFFLTFFPSFNFYIFLFVPCSFLFASSFLFLPFRLFLLISFSLSYI